MTMETTEPQRFGLMLRRPGDEGIYIAPDFIARHEKWATDARDDPRWDEERQQHWALSLPHRCDEWNIGHGTREEVLADAYRLRAELDAAIAAMEAAG
jgi:hypothetical protein